MFFKDFFTAKTLEETSAKVFFILIFCLNANKFVKIFDIDIMRFGFISNQQ